MSHNIEVESGNTIRLPTAGKYCDRDIVVTATGGGGSGGGDENLKNFIEGNFPDGFTFPDGVTKIRNYCFYYANFLTDVVLPDSVTEIGNYAFSFSSLVSIYGKNVVNTMNNPFTGAPNFKSANFPNLVKPSLALFYNCYYLENVNLPNVERLPMSMFRNCSSLKKLDLPKCKKLDFQVFYNCSSLTTLILRNDAIVTGDNTAFEKTPIADGTGFVYVPDDLVESYKSATNWSNIASQIKGLSELGT